MHVLCKVLLYAGLSCFLICGAKATPVCLNEQDVYLLAIADMNGSGEQKWGELVTNGVCRDVSATYLWSLESYKEPELTYISVYLAMGRYVYGLTTTLPPWLKAI